MTPTLQPPPAYRGYMIDDIPGPVRECFLALSADWPGTMNAGHRLVLYGPEGMLKTTSMAAMQNALGLDGWMSWWLDCFDLSRDPVQADEDLAPLRAASFLFIDDLGKEAPHLRPKLGDLIAYRVQRNYGVTVYTTNVAVDENDRNACELTELYGAAVRSRILGNAKLVHMDGPDYRMKDS